MPPPGARFRGLRAAHLRFGQRGEALAVRLLRQLGMEVLTTNYVGPHGEIDIVARDGEMLCFVEVKARRRSERSRPADAVTPQKIWRIVRTAERYLRQIGRPPLIYRFDIVEIVFAAGRLFDVRHWPGEFTSADAKRYASRPFTEN